MVLNNFYGRPVRPSKYSCKLVAVIGFFVDQSGIITFKTLRARRMGRMPHDKSRGEYTGIAKSRIL